VPARPDDELTIGAVPSTVTPPLSARTPSRYAPGAIVAGRYRLVALLGRGGMGEVYRADDLTLDQPVALKFLPEGVAADSTRLAQFHNELRVARQVSHKNVCRLYDLGEADGRRFLTMEYVDGEDLASLLRRIGRFPQDRAIAIARQLCAAVAAAHDRGVIHRDLKPANVMIDGDGNVRVTDFGIATAVAGTPQYMAPEQFTGVDASTTTDLYALGLILFEIFTGKPMHEAKSIADLKAWHETGAVTTPSSIVRDLDPAVERVILRCLDRDPRRRPASALAVAAALPGGNPLADALASGETPSPALLVAAAETDALPIARGLALVAALLAACVIYAVLSPRATMAGLVPLDKPPAVLADRAQQILGEFGYTDRPADSAEGFVIPPDFGLWRVGTDRTTHRWDAAQMAVGPALSFWYRTSPTALSPVRPSPAISPIDPPQTSTGMSLVIVDPRGRLQEFHVVPPQHDPTPPGPAPRWETAFRAAGLDPAAFAPVTPEWTPRDFADVRAAWEGPSADRADIRLRIEAAAYRGRITSFYLIGPWSRATRMQPLTVTTLNRVLVAFSALLGVAVVLGAVLLARHNVRAARADRRSAARLAAVYVIVNLATWALAAHHVSAIAAENSNFQRFLGMTLFGAGVIWVLYLALEPYGRRFWPDGLLGWTRLFSGHVRDPRIGRELLVGCALGGVLMLIDLARSVAPYALGRPPGVPALGSDVRALEGAGGLALAWVQQFNDSLQTALVITMLFVVLRLLVRRISLAVAIGLVIVTIMAGANMPVGGVLWLDAIAQVVAIGVITFAIFRCGLLVTAVLLLVDNIPTAVPFVWGTGSWASTAGLLSMALVLAVAGFGFYASRAGQPLFGKVEVKS
jgi:protein kinase-like protein